MILESSEEVSISHKSRLGRIMYDTHGEQTNYGTGFTKHNPHQHHGYMTPTMTTPLPECRNDMHHITTISVQCNVVPSSEAEIIKSTVFP